MHGKNLIVNARTVLMLWCALIECLNGRYFLFFFGYQNAVFFFKERKTAHVKTYPACLTFFESWNFRKKEEKKQLPVFASRDSNVTAKLGGECDVNSYNI